MFTWHRKHYLSWFEHYSAVLHKVAFTNATHMISLINNKYSLRAGGLAQRIECLPVAMVPSLNLVLGFDDEGGLVRLNNKYVDSKNIFS